MKKNKKGIMDIILIVIAIFIVGFVIVMIGLYYRTGGIPDTLCTCVFAICGGECGIMGWIKTTKERYRERKYELEDKEQEESIQKEEEIL